MHRARYVRYRSGGGAEGIFKLGGWWEASDGERLARARTLRGLLREWYGGDYERHYHDERGDLVVVVRGGEEHVWTRTGW